MFKEYWDFVKEHDIDKELAKRNMFAIKRRCIADYGDLATPKVINRNALFQLMTITGIKG